MSYKLYYAYDLCTMYTKLWFCGSDGLKVNKVSLLLHDKRFKVLEEKEKPYHILSPKSEYLAIPKHTENFKLERTLT